MSLNFMPSGTYKYCIGNVFEMSSKRKHNTLTLKDKLEILKKLDEGENMCNIAKDFNIGRATVYDIKKKKSVIIEHVNAMEKGPGERKTLKASDYPIMEFALFNWFLQERAKHTPVSDEILRSKAIELYREITKKDDFQSSDRWLKRFKKKFGIRLLPISRENLSNDESAVIPVVKEDVKDINLNKQEITEEKNQLITDNICEVVMEEYSDELYKPVFDFQPTVTSEVVLESFNNCITWAEENGVITEEIMVLQKLRQKVLETKPMVKKKRHL